MKSRFLGTLEVSPHRHGLHGALPRVRADPAHDESIAAIRAAYDFGCTFFDTAEGIRPQPHPREPWA